jgi:hypothetical protein
MENQIEKLLSLGLDLNKFYVISLLSNEIQLQGHATGSLMNDLIKLGYELDYDKESNWLQYRSNNLKITLTFKY